jgi:hypothetical protein
VALLGVGAAGVVALVVAAGVTEDSLWTETWWWVGTVALGGVTALGVYVLAAVYFPLPLPETRAAREARAQITFGDIKVSRGGDGFKVIEVPVELGHLDVANASLNVRVPGSVVITGSDQMGLTDMSSGEMAYSTGSMEGHPGGVNYWRTSGVPLSAFTNTSFCYRLEYTDSQEPFPFQFRLYAAALQGGVEARVTVDPNSMFVLPSERSSNDGA